MASTGPPPPERNLSLPGPSGTKPKKTRRSLSYEVKYTIIQELEKGTRQVDLARQHGVNESTIRTIKKDAAKIKEHMKIKKSTGASMIKYFHNQVLLKTEKLLVRYLVRQARRNMAVDTRSVKDYARELYMAVARKMGTSEPKPFNASSGWLQRFKIRNKITNINIGGEAASADRAAAREFPPFLREIMEEGQYSDDQVFTMDESGLFWKKLPSKSFVVKNASRIRGRKMQKERITVLFTTNASGTCKLKLSVIHTARKPHAYKSMDMTKLNVHWLTARKAWMFSTLSLSWFDDCFVPDVKKFCERQNVPFNILSLLDNALGHSPLLLDRHPNVKVVFLPPNTTSLIQPMDQELICNVKAAFSTKKFQLLNDYTNTREELRNLSDTTTDSKSEEDEDQQLEQQKILFKQFWRIFNIKKAVDFLVESWDQLSIATIRHAWRHVLHGIPGERRSQSVTGEVQNVAVAVDLAREAAQTVTVPGFSETTNDDILEVIRDPEVTADEMLEEEHVSEEEEEGASVSEEHNLSHSDIKGAMECAEKMKSFLSRDNDRYEVFHTQLVQAMEPYIKVYHDNINASRQQSIKDFFARNPPQPAQASDSDSEVDFEGFVREALTTVSDSDGDSPSNGDSPEGQ
ncbi:Tigger transposable element-derived protein 1-like 20 [Homarus americanus]|uniref:Tigger transposable element-derived protein 1-like 20 n=1 Tax=Homarus americanus TaxID=6706 RepID=A0A8J5N6R4_HOMAM|nr:Tigger transposable element-derived protein 1-like 20 [Homarus americanus]